MFIKGVTGLRRFWHSCQARTTIAGNQQQQQRSGDSFLFYAGLASDGVTSQRRASPFFKQNTTGLSFLNQLHRSQH